MKPKFHYKQKVRVTGGFYRTHLVEVNSYNEVAEWFNKKIIAYRVFSKEHLGFWSVEEKDLKAL